MRGSFQAPQRVLYVMVHKYRSVLCGSGKSTVSYFYSHKPPECRLFTKILNLICSEFKNHRFDILTKSKLKIVTLIDKKSDLIFVIVALVQLK